jgi:signal transduction histidine kinase
MRQRASYIGATLTVESLPDTGTTVSCILPKVPIGVEVRSSLAPAVLSA